MTNMTTSDFLAILPLVALIVWALVLLLVDLWVPVQHKRVIPLLAAVGLLTVMGLTLGQSGQDYRSAFHGMVMMDGFSVFLNVLFLASGLAGIALAYDYLKRMGIERSEYYILLLFTISGMMLMAYASDLIMVFLALELLSIPLYILAGFARPRADSEEAALKYFLLGAFASGFVLYGVAMTYGATAHTDLQGIVQSIADKSANPTLLLVGAGLLLVGLGYKVAAVPFHMWTPDVYQGSPSAVTGFMSVGAKAAGFAALLRVFITAYQASSLPANIVPIIWSMAALTMLVGNIAAIAQGNIKRMLAYSSIAHAGYILMAFASIGQKQALSNAVASTLFYLVSYAITSCGAWAVGVALEKAEGVGSMSRGLELADYAGLGRKYPYLAAAMLVFMLSFTGIPPTLGFWGKFYLFRTAVEGNNIPLAVVGLLASLISAFYYLRIVIIMYMRPGEVLARRENWVNLLAIGSALATLVLGFLPGPLFDLASRAILRY
jgi:NADH-quinone oxidoreductase subunit N